MRDYGSFLYSYESVQWENKFLNPNFIRELKNDFCSGRITAGN